MFNILYLLPGSLILEYSSTVLLFEHGNMDHNTFFNRSRAAIVPCAKPDQTLLAWPFCCDC